MPAVTGSPNTPTVDVNNDPGMRLSSWDAAGSQLARDHKIQIKALALRTTGYPISVKCTKIGQLQIDILYAMDITLKRAAKQHYPRELFDHEVAILFIDLSYSGPRHVPWYNIPLAASTNRSVMQFGMWLKAFSENKSLHQGPEVKKERPLHFAELTSAVYGLRSQYSLEGDQ